MTYLKEEGYNLDLLGSVLSMIKEPFLISGQLYDDEFVDGFKQVESVRTRYQVMYLALSEFNHLYLTTSTEGAVAYLPVTNIYDYQFELQENTLGSLGNLFSTLLTNLLLKW